MGSPPVTTAGTPLTVTSANSFTIPLTSTVNESNSASSNGERISITGTVVSTTLKVAEAVPPGVITSSGLGPTRGGLIDPGSERTCDPASLTVPPNCHTFTKINLGIAEIHSVHRDFDRGPEHRAGRRHTRDDGCALPPS